MTSELHTPTLLPNFVMGGGQELEGKARTRPEILRVVLGPYVQNCPCEASEQKLGQEPKPELTGIELSYCHHSICLRNKSILKKICHNWMKSDQVMPI